MVILICFAARQLSQSRITVFELFFLSLDQFKQKVLVPVCMFLGAECVLDELLIKKNQVEEWVYKEKHDHQLVSAVCIQIKGDIQFNLGQWSKGAKFLLESLILFRYCAKRRSKYFIV